MGAFVRGRGQANTVVAATDAEKQQSEAAVAAAAAGPTAAAGTDGTQASPPTDLGDFETWREATFYRCLESGESYGAAWFATTASVLRRYLETGPKQAMETGGGLGLPLDLNTPLKTVDVLDFSVEHLSWLERRIGLRDMTGEPKRLLTAQLVEHMRAREAKVRGAALSLSGEETTRKHFIGAVAGRGGGGGGRGVAGAADALAAALADAARVGAGEEGSPQRSPPTPPEGLPETNQWAYLYATNTSAPHRSAQSRNAPPFKVLAIFPYFATHSHCHETLTVFGEAKGQAANVTKNPTSTTSLERCDSGSSDPLMRRFFLNLTFWTVHAKMTPHIALSTCSGDDESFARQRSGLPFFHVFRSDCRIFNPEHGRVVFKPELLGVLTVMRLQEVLVAVPKFTDFTHVFYNEADQVVHLRLSVGQLVAATSKRHQEGEPVASPAKNLWLFPNVVPHRLQPVSDPIDLPALGGPLGKLGGGLARWVSEDLARVASVKNRSHFPPSNPPALRKALREALLPLSASGPVGEGEGSCCLDRGECQTRKHWLPWKKLPGEGQLGVMKIGDSLTMVAAEGNFNKLLFRQCTTFRERQWPCP